jgi:hypothetical protein
VVLVRRNGWFGEQREAMEEWEFLEKIERADEDLATKRVSIHSRPFHAFHLLAPDYVGPILGYGINKADYPPFVGPNLLDRICDWYKDRYGDRVNLPSDRARIPIVVRGEVYLVRIPLVFGSVRVPILRLVEGLTESMADALTETELNAIIHAFEAGFALTYEFEDLSQELEQGKVSATGATQNMLQSAIADRDTAVQCLSGRLDTNGACFHAQQHAEKMLKVYLLVNNVSTELQLSRPPYGHDLKRIHDLCATTSGDFLALSSDVGLLSNIPMDIRYTVPKVEPTVAVETAWAALRIGGFCACRIVGQPRRYRA